ncbi:MAG: phage/plasmid replication domain-containing protein [Candidatus Muiribacteriota bacterium]
MANVNLDDLHKPETLIAVDALNMLPGIDTLYYFYSTLPEYQSFFEDLESRVSRRKVEFDEAKKDKFVYGKDTNFLISLLDVDMIYTGHSEGFRWFSDVYETYRIGFKHPAKNQGLNNIRVQLGAKGIYTIGIKNLLEQIENFLSGLVGSETYITRMDVNCFIQADLSNIAKEMFVTKKRNARQYIKEYGNTYKNETIYIGKKPFVMRLYNKMEELKNSPKLDLMFEYFNSNGLEVTGWSHVYNLEFELSRDFLKRYGISSVDEALNSAELLFKEALEHIRMIDLDSLSKADLEHNRRYNADTHILWQYLKDNYTLANIMQQSTVALEKLKTAEDEFKIFRYFADTVAVIRRAKKNGQKLNTEFLKIANEQVKREYEIYKKHRLQPSNNTKSILESEYIKSLHYAYKALGKNFDRKAFEQKNYLQKVIT